jgi:hypothetical protein
LGSIHGCIAVGSRRRPSRSSFVFASAMFAPKTVAFELADVQRELVVPRDVAILELFRGMARRGFEQLVGRGCYVERFRVDEHVFDLDAERVEQAQRLVGARLYALFVAVLGPAGLNRRV